MRENFLLVDLALLAKMGKYNCMAMANARNAMRSGAAPTADAPAQAFCKAALVDGHVQTVHF